MTEEVKDNTTEEFEELLGRRLWGDLDRPGRNRLLQLLAGNPEYQALYSQATEQSELLVGEVEVPPFEELSGETLIRAELEAGLGSSPATAANAVSARGFSGGFARAFAATAAAGVLAAMGYFFYNPEGGPNSGPSDIMTIGSGDCSSRLFPGDGERRPPRQEVEAGKTGPCNLHIKREFSVAVRLLPGSKLRVREQKSKLLLSLDRGDLFVESTKLSKGKDLWVTAGNLNIRFLGTRVYVHRQRKSGMQVDVLEGKVQVRRSRIYAMEELVAGRNEFELKELSQAEQEIFGEELRVLNQGTSLVYKASKEPKEASLAKLETQLLLEKKLSISNLKEWRESLPEKTRKRLERKGGTPSEKIMAKGKLEYVNRAVDRFPGFRSKGVSGTPGTPEKPGTPKPDSPEAKKKVRKDNYKVVRKVLREVEELERYTIKLKNGKIIKGFAYEKNGNYIIISGGERTVLKRSRIDTITLDDE